MSNGTDNFPVMPPYPSKEEREYIDAKLAQARASGVRAADDFRQLVSDSDTAEIKEWKARATAAEAKLEAIRQGVGGLIGRPDNWIKRDEVLALLQPQPQADESGMPG